MLTKTYEPGFKQRVEAIVAQIPKGKVMTYGQLASLCEALDRRGLLVALLILETLNFLGIELLINKVAWQVAILVVKMVINKFLSKIIMKLKTIK